MKNNKLLVSVFISSLSAPISAQIVLDGTLGRQGTLPGPDFAIGAELGQQHGSNLFHSFSDFNIHQGESATFSGPNSINNIISRVTGGTVSTINGLLRSMIPKANFYFLNPAGIIFDKQASLDVQGAFHVSTADYIGFDDGSQFHASQPQNSLLTVASPQTFGFLTSPKPISVYSQLTVPDTQTISMIGGDINFIQGGVHAPAGHIYLASTASAGEVHLNPETDFSDTMTELGDIKLSEQSTVGNGADEFDGAQRIYIRGGLLFRKQPHQCTSVQSHR
jgi:filamentous hemagglutinin family protein